VVTREEEYEVVLVVGVAPRELSQGRDAFVELFKRGFFGLN
jgi:hypothetical protein